MSAQCVLTQWQKAGSSFPIFERFSKKIGPRLDTFERLARGEIHLPYEPGRDLKPCDRVAKRAQASSTNYQHAGRDQATAGIIHQQPREQSLLSWLPRKTKAMTIFSPELISVGGTWGDEWVSMVEFMAKRSTIFFQSLSYGAGEG